MKPHPASFTLGVAAILAAASLSAPALATNGYFSHGYGTKSKGMAGAGIALPQDSLIATTNPAGMAFAGARMDYGVSVFNPVREYKLTGSPSGVPGTFGLGEGTTRSRKEAFFVPHFGYNHILKDGASVGIAVFGNGGMNTTYPVSANDGAGSFYAGPAGVNLEQLFIAPTYARKWNADSAWGVAPVLAYQRFEAKGLQSLGGFVCDQNPDSLSDRGIDHSTGVGLRVGAQTKARPDLTVAAAYQTKVRMGRFDKYSDLFAGHGRFDIPPTGTVGLAWQNKPGSVLAFDIQHIWYSDVPAVGNPFINLNEGMSGEDPECLLGGDNGPGFGWRDMTVYKLGYQMEAAKDWTARAGVSYGKQPIGDSEVLFNILAPGVQEWHFTGGVTRRTGKKGEFSVAVTYSPTKSVTGPNPLEVPGQQSIEISMHQLDIEASWAQTF